jgi:hypothetical protein
VTPNYAGGFWREGISHPAELSEIEPHSFDSQDAHLQDNESQDHRLEDDISYEGIPELFNEAV